LLVLCCWSPQITDDGVGKLFGGVVAAQVLGLHLKNKRTKFTNKKKRYFHKVKKEVIIQNIRRQHTVQNITSGTSIGLNSFPVVYHSENGYLSYLSLSLTFSLS
jgi:hypothetical protein